MITERIQCSQSNWVSQFTVYTARIVIVVVACVLLVSCLPLGSPGESTRIDPKWSQTLKGRFIYKSPEDSFSAVFTWKSKGSVYELRLRDRLGLRRIRIEGDGELADVETPDGQTLRDVDVQTWLEQELAISVPILELPKCLTMDCSFAKLGENHVYDELGRLIEFSHGVWTVQATYEKKATGDSNTVKEIQVLDGKTKMRLIFDS